MSTTVGSETQYGPHNTILRSIYEVDPPMLEQLAQWLEQRGLTIPVGQVVGYQQERLVVKLTRSTVAQSIPSGAQTDLTFDPVDGVLTVDEQKLFNGSTTLTLPYNGTYIVSGHFSLNGGTSGQSSHYLLQNGVLRAGMDLPMSATFGGPRSTLATLIVGRKGDAIKHAAFQSSGGALNVFEATFELALLNRY